MEMNESSLSARCAEEILTPAPIESAADSVPAAEATDTTDAEETAEMEMTDAIQKEAAEHRTRPATPEEVIAAACEILAREAADIAGDDVRRMRSLWNAARPSAENTADGAEPDAEAVAAAVKQEEMFAAILTQIRDKKAAWTAEQEALRAANLERKNAIIDEITALADDTDNVNRTFPRYRELQNEFNAIGDVEPTEETGVWKRFQDARERYSDNLKINKELRDYDFKKNLDSKTLLLEEAESLAAEEDVITAYRRLQELHNKWRRIGPVAKELRDEIWDKFKAASAIVNKRYQAHFEERKAREAEAEAAKEELCAQVEAIDIESLNGFSAWDKATATIQELQGRWREMGFASRRANRDLFARFRAACDRFFAAKAEYFRKKKAGSGRRNEENANLAAKRALVDRLNALDPESPRSELQAAIKEIQDEWQTIGHVPFREKDKVYEQYRARIDELRDGINNGRRRERREQFAGAVARMEGDSSSRTSNAKSNGCAKTSPKFPTKSKCLPVKGATPACPVRTVPCGQGILQQQIPSITPDGFFRNFSD